MNKLNILSFLKSYFSEVLLFVSFFYFFVFLNLKNYHSSIFQFKKSNYIEPFNKFLLKKLSQNKIRFESKCRCRSDILIEKQNSYYTIISKNISYILTVDEIDNAIFTCDYYNSLRRNKNQKVLSYSLYGKNKRYYNLLKNLSLTIKRKYQGWIMRIYYDNSIDKSFICELECLKDEKNVLLDNVDFCNVQKLPIGNLNKETWSVSNLHAMMWRWLLIGDSFVDVFLSRDSDSMIIQREIDSVNVWLNSSKIIHIMRGKFF